MAEPAAEQKELNPLWITQEYSLYLLIKCKTPGETYIVETLSPIKIYDCYVVEEGLSTTNHVTKNIQIYQPIRIVECTVPVLYEYIVIWGMTPCLVFGLDEKSAKENYKNIITGLKKSQQISKEDEADDASFIEQLLIKYSRLNGID